MVEWSHQVQVEIDFWVARRLDLQSVVEQLYSEKVLEMSRLLEKTLSSYYLAYCSMLQTIDQSLEKASDVR